MNMKKKTKLLKIFKSDVLKMSSEDSSKDYKEINSVGSKTNKW